MHMIEDKDAELIVIVGLTRKVHLFCIVLYRNLFSSPLSSEARGIATKSMQHGLIGGGIVQMIEDKRQTHKDYSIFALC